MQAAIFGLGPTEIIIILVILAVLFVPSILPRLFKRLGETVGTVREMVEKDEKETDEEE